MYLCALLLPGGRSASEISGEDNDSVIFENVEVQEDLGRILITEEGMKRALYHDCPEEDFELARRLISPQPIAPLGTPVEVTEAFGRVRRTYVHTT